MAGSTPRLPEQFQAERPGQDFDVSELLSNAAGAHSPFGDTELPVPPHTLSYEHPTPDTRPHLAGGH